MSAEVKGRNSAIEILRILAMCGVVILHYNHPSMGGAFSFAEMFSPKSYILYFLECMFACAVNTYLIISGYYMCGQKKISIWKLLKLIIEVIVIKEAVYILYVLMGMKTFSWKVVIIYLLPANYYVILYVALSLIAPFVNLLLDKLDTANFRKLLIVFGLVFAVWPTMVDVMITLSGNSLTGLSTVSMYGSQYGYCIVNFVLMYIIGAAIRKKVFTLNSVVSVVGMLLSWGLMFVWSQIALYKNWGTSVVLSYCNPLVIISAVCVFFIFTNRKPFHSKIVNVLAKGSFTVFLLHTSLFRRSQIHTAVQGNIFGMVAHVILTSV